MTEPTAPTNDNHIKLLRRFANFWSSVSSIHIARGVPHDTQAAVVRGFDKAYGTEKTHGKQPDAE